MAKKFKGSSIKRENTVEMFGVSDLLKSIEAAGGRVDEAVKQAVSESLKIVGEDMQTFMAKHKLTGDTLESFDQPEPKIEGNTVTAIVGYDTKKGGTPAIFLDVGTPKRKPYFFRYYAVENNRKKIQEIQRAKLNEILKGLK